MAARDIIQAAAGAAGATEAVYVEDVFSNYLYAGSSATQTINNGIDLATKGGMVWLKSRSGTVISSYDKHFLFDTARSNTVSLSTNNAAANESGWGSNFFRFLSTGFDTGSDSSATNQQYLNKSGVSYVSWTFRKQPKFFDIVTFSVTASTNQRVSHALGVTPGLILVKKVSGPQDWYVYHKSLGRSYFGILNSTDTFLNVSNVWGTTDPTSTDFGMWSSYMLGSTGDYIAYLFADSNSGGFGPAGTDSVVACGSYTGNGSASGPTVTLGWEPQFVLIKNASQIVDWHMFDTMRGWDNSSSDMRLRPNSSAAESNYYTGFGEDFGTPTATGFKINSAAAAVNENGSSHIYLAIRRGPMKTPTDATKVFKPSYIGGGVTLSENYSAIGFAADTILRLDRGGQGYTNQLTDRLRGWFGTTVSNGAELLFTYLTNAESNSGSYLAQKGDMGFDFGGSWNGYQLAHLYFRRAPGFFDVVCYTGTGAYDNISHNLGVPPELVIAKSRSNGTQYWIVGRYNSDGKGGFLNTADAFSQSWSVGDPKSTSTTFQKNADNSGYTYVAYLFATCPGVSKVGSYTGNGSSQTIDCGFTAGARFVLIKRTDAAGDWYVWDTARGIVAGNDPHLLLNQNIAEVTSNDTIDPASSGFIVNQVAATNVNVSSAKYIYLAIA